MSWLHIWPSCSLVKHWDEHASMRNSPCHRSQKRRQVRLDLHPLKLVVEEAANSGLSKNVGPKIDGHWLHSARRVKKTYDSVVNLWVCISGTGHHFRKGSKLEKGYGCTVKWNYGKKFSQEVLRVYILQKIVTCSCAKLMFHRFSTSNRFLQLFKFFFFIILVSTPVLRSFLSSRILHFFQVSLISLLIVFIYFFSKAASNEIYLWFVHFSIMTSLRMDTQTMNSASK